MEDPAKPSCVLHLRGLPGDITEAEVAALGQPFGTVNDVILTRNKNQVKAKYLFLFKVMVFSFLFIMCLVSFNFNLLFFGVLSEMHFFRSAKYSYEMSLHVQVAVVLFC